MTKTRAVNLFRGEPYDTYMGGPDNDQSPKELKVGELGYLGNPFTEGTPEENFARFKDYFLERMENDSLFRKSVLALKGSRLGGIKDPGPYCHVSYIADFLDSQ